jgi:hypothetical protein
VVRPVAPPKDRSAGGIPPNICTRPEAVTNGVEGEESPFGAIAVVHATFPVAESTFIIDHSTPSPEGQ